MRGKQEKEKSQNEYRREEKRELRGRRGVEKIRMLAARYLLGLINAVRNSRHLHYITRGRAIDEKLAVLAPNTVILFLAIKITKIVTFAILQINKS